MPQLNANGITIDYEILGPDSAPPLMLVMGLGQQGIAWPDSFCQMLVDGGYKVIRFDNRDTGFSTKFDEAGPQDVMALMGAKMGGQPVTVPYTLDDMAADAAGLIDGLGLGKVHVVGASMGGMIVQLLAINHADKLHSVTSIMSTTANPDLPPATDAAMGALFSVPEDPTSRESILDNMVAGRKVIGSPGFMDSDEVIRTNAARTVDRDYYPVGVTRHTAAVIAADNRVPALQKVDLPFLVLHGKDDPLIPVECGIDTAKAVPGARLEIIDGYGHDVATAVQPILARHILDHVRAVDAKQSVAAE